MRAAEWIEWGRAPRGRVWHILSPFGGVDVVAVHRDAALCSLEHQVVEATRGLPPRGARVCSECAHRVADLGRVLQLAGSEPEPVTDYAVQEVTASVTHIEGRPIEDVASL